MRREELKFSVDTACEMYLKEIVYGEAGFEDIANDQSKSADITGSCGVQDPGIQPQC